MLRAAILIMITLVCGACDTLYPISASKTIPAPLEQKCVLDALRTEKAVRAAGIDDHGQLWFELTIPDNVLIRSERPERPLRHPVIGVYTRRNDAGEVELLFEMSLLNRKETPEYRAHVQKVLEELRDRVVERCGGR